MKQNSYSEQESASCGSWEAFSVIRVFLDWVWGKGLCWWKGKVNAPPSALFLLCLVLLLMEEPLRAGVVLCSQDLVGEEVHELFEIGSTLWVATDGGAYQILGDRLEPRFTGGEVTGIFPSFSKTVALATDKGVLQGFDDDFRTLIYEAKSESPPVKVSSVTRLKEKRGRLHSALRKDRRLRWLGTEQGLYRLEGAGSKKVLTGRITGLVRRSENEIYVGREDAVVILNEDSYEVSDNLMKDARVIAGLDVAKSSLWIRTTADPRDRNMRKESVIGGPLYLYDGSQQSARVFDYTPVTRVVIHEGDMFYLRPDGIFGEVAGKPEEVLREKGIRDFALDNGVFVISSSGLLRRHRQGSTAKTPVSEISLLDSFRADQIVVSRDSDNIWVVESGRLCRIDFEARLEVLIARRDGLFESGWWEISEPNYLGLEGFSKGKRPRLRFYPYKLEAEPEDMYSELDEIPTYLKGTGVVELETKSRGVKQLLMVDEFGNHGVIELPGIGPIWWIIIGSCGLTVLILPALITWQCKKLKGIWLGLLISDSSHAECIVPKISEEPEGRATD